MCVQILHRLIKYLVCYNYSTFRRFRHVDIHMNQAVVFIASLPFGKHIHIYYSTLTDYITSYPWTTLHIYIRMMGCKCNKFMRFMYILIS